MMNSENNKTAGGVAQQGATNAINNENPQHGASAHDGAEHTGPRNEARWLTPTEQRVWRKWLDLGTRINNATGRELQRDSDISLADYEVLVHLSEAPDHRKRIVALAEMIRWERSRLSHQITRMAKRGLVRRESCENDGRGAYVILEEHGLEVIEATAPGHADTVRNLMFEQLDAKHLAALEDVLKIIEPQVAAQERRTAEALEADRRAKKARR